MQLLWRLTKQFNGKLVITAVLSLSLVIGGVAFADDKNGEGAPDPTHTGSTGTRLYQPPDDLLSPFGDGSEGRRGGCTGDAQISLTALPLKAMWDKRLPLTLPSLGLSRILNLMR